MLLTSSVKARAAYWANLQVLMSIDWKEWNFVVY